MDYRQLRRLPVCLRISPLLLRRITVIFQLFSNSRQVSTFRSVAAVKRRQINAFNSVGRVNGKHPPASSGARYLLFAQKKNSLFTAESLRLENTAGYVPPK